MDENRFSYIDSSIVNFASTNLDRQNILGTLWFHELELENIPETWKIANLLVRRNFFPTIGIDSARGATILFNPKRRYRLPRLLFTESTVHRVSRSPINQTNCRPRHLIACFEIRDAHPSHAFLQDLRIVMLVDSRARVWPRLILYISSFFIYLFIYLLGGKRFNFSRIDLR